MNLHEVRLLEPGISLDQTTTITISEANESWRPYVYNATQKLTQYIDHIRSICLGDGTY